MRKFLTGVSALFTALALHLLSLPASAQTLTLNDGAIVQPKTSRVGVNIGTVDYWDNGQVLKNLIGSTDPGMEPLQNRQIWALAASGTTTSFTVPDVYDTVPANYWTGGTFTVVQSQNGGSELGCTGTIISNTGPNNPVASVTTWVAPTITTATPCAAPFQVGDVIVINKVTFPTPESWWESDGHGGTSGSVSGGGQLLSDTTDLCSTCGVQALNLNATASGSKAAATWYFDSEFADNIFVLMNGTYQVSFWAKAASGTPTLTVSASRQSSNGFNCGSYTPKLTATWTQYTWSCTASETSATTPAASQVSFSASAGSVYLDNVSFQKTSGNPNNTTVLRDEVIQSLQTFYGPSIGENPGTLRYWVNQNAESMSNWTQPDYAHLPTAGGTGYYVGPGGSGAESLSLEDYLVICKYLNASPYLEVPVTLSTTEASNLIEFLAGPSNSTYGARRAALGQIDPWTDQFSVIHLSFCNECWNGRSFLGQGLPDRSSSPNQEYYYDYSMRARDIFAAMRSNASYSASSFDMVLNAQTAVNYTADVAIARAHPDSIEVESYTYGTVNSFATDAELWQPAMVDPWQKATNPNDIRNFYQSVHDYQSQNTCGASGTAKCNVNIYEWGQGTISGTIDQQHLDYINAGGGEGAVMALQPLLNMQYYGIGAQSFFALGEFKNPNGSLTAKLWGNVVDMGGATNNSRPTYLGVSLINQSIIGPMYSCSINNNLTYNFAGSPNGVAAMPAMANVPYLYAFCFENGNSRSLVLINTDLTNSHSISFAGSNLPAGAVTQRQLAPPSLNAMNETNTGTLTTQAQATVAIETSSLSSPKSITLPPYSVTALDYTAGSSAAAAMPTFSPAGGTYTSTQSVTISDATAGVSIYYTTDGSTPTTSSSLYTGPISVSGNETLQAIAVSSGASASFPASATYVIAPQLPSPTFSVAAGTYPTTQTVSISDATAGTTIYYTTNGTAPTTSSTVYSGPITVSATETLEAIAVKAGSSNSAVASAAYTISAQLPAPVFSVAPGVYHSAMSVKMSDTATGANIYYTTDGSTPTASSTMYSGGLWLTSTETIKAVAIQSGKSTSPVLSGTFTISPILPTPSFSPGAGVYTSVQSVALSSTVAGVTFYYTTDGSTPTTASARYTGPISVGASETLQAIATANNYTNSAVGAANYIINIAKKTVATPVFSVAAGTYSSTQTVSISDATAGAAIYYTTDGSAPTTSSAKYAGPVTVSASTTLKAIAALSGYNNSAVATATYTLSSGKSVAAPVFSVASGTYASTQSVTISDATAGATIYYTTNGTTPLTTSAKYKGAIKVSSSTTLTAMAVETGYTNSPVSTATYTISSTSGSSSGTTLPAPTFSVAAGTYASAQSVSINGAVAGSTIYYSTDGTAPTTASNRYTTPVTVSASETLKAAAVATGYQSSPIATAAYVISSTTGSSSTTGKTYINIGNNAFSASTLSLNNGATVTGGLLQLTDGGIAEQRTAWFGKEVPVNAFTTDFTFKLTQAAANGFTFTVQSSPKGEWAVGYSGDGLGYQSIINSVAITFNIYDQVGSGKNSIGMAQWGTAPMSGTNIDLTGSGITLKSGDLIHAHLVYNGSAITATLTDTVTAATVTKSFSVNIPNSIGSTSAYVGFTGATGASTAVQQVASWTYSGQ